MVCLCPSQAVAKTLLNIHTHPQQEELADFKKRNQERTTEEIVEVVLIRIATNVFTTLVLVGAGVAIFYAAQFSLDFVRHTHTRLYLILEM